MAAPGATGGKVKGSKRGHDRPSLHRGAHEREVHTATKLKFCGARMYATSGSHTDTGNWQGVPFHAEDYDTSPQRDMVNLTSDSFDIPFNGYYDIRFQVRFAGTTGGRRRARILVNGTETSVSEPASATDDANAEVTPMAIWRGPLKKGDEVTFESLQGSGSGLAYTTGSANLWAEIQLVGV